MHRSLVLGLGCLFLGLSAAAQQPSKKDDVPKFIENLSAKEVKLRLAAVEGIAEVGEIKAMYAKDAIAPLVEVLKNDEEAKVREAAALALTRIDADAARAVPALIDRLKNEKDERALQASIASVGYYGPTAKDALPLLKEYHDKTMAEIAKIKEEVAKVREAGQPEKIQEILRKSAPVRQMNGVVTQAMRSIDSKQK